MINLPQMRLAPLCSFEHLYEQYYWPLYRRVYRMLGRRECTEDVMQDTFLKAFRASATIRSDGNTYAWLCRIAKNAAIDHVRRCEQAICLSLDVLRWKLADRGTTAPDPQTRYEGTYELVAEALIHLPAHYREALLMSWKGYTQAEIAGQFGKTSRTIRAWLALAKACLAETVVVS
jgi:RNA polymerase sigma-70 factor (ECF subfamily)